MSSQVPLCFYYSLEMELRHEKYVACWMDGGRHGKDAAEELDDREMKVLVT